MKDNKEQDILKEIRSIIGDDIYNEMEGGRKMKQTEKTIRHKRKKVVGGEYEEDKRNEGDKGETYKNKNNLEEEDEVAGETESYVKSQKIIYNEETEESDNRDENIELQHKENSKGMHKKQKGFENWSVATKDNVCKFYFLKGRCKYEENCFFSHDVTPLYKTSKLCKFQLKGSCKKSHCPFSHNINMFYCRNDLIGGNCKNPSCEFKHVPLEVKFKDQKSRNVEVDQVLSNADKNLFVFNNKSFIMNILIRNYFNFSSLEDVNLNEINKNENYPWYINSAIDLLKLDLQQNKIHYFYRLIKNYFKEKAQNILSYVDDEKLKLQLEQEMLPGPTEEETLNNTQQKETLQTETKCNTANVENECLNNENLKSEYLKSKRLKRKHLKSEQLKNEPLKNKHLKNEHLKSEHMKNEHLKNKHIKSPNKETDTSVYEYKVFSSDEDEDYSKYLNTYLEIRT